jgi:Na+/proline symporter
MGTFQILLFALIAIKIKANAPGCHTFPEIVLARHGRIAHLTYLFNGLATNMLVGSCLVLGGSQVVAAITGMNVYGACFLIPLVVAAYVIAGGLRSTFIADYVHTVVLFIAIFVFGFLVYATSDLVGSPDRFFDLLLEASKKMPIATNPEGSYLAFKSVDGLVFAIDLFAAGFSTVWLDQAYWQRAIASRPETSVRAYLLVSQPYGERCWMALTDIASVSQGGIAWYGIPFGFATAMGLGCAALTSNPSFPTYPNPLSAAENGAGLSSPATAITLLGQGGAVLMLVLLFMAVTSSSSAELIAVSSLLTFDVYKTYINPEVSSTRLVQVSHYGIVLYALVLAGFCCILNVVGLNLTWLLTILAIIVGGASIPIGFILLWERMSTAAAIGAPWIGLICGLIAWFVTTWKRSGSITVETTGNTINAVAGNVTSWGVGFLMSGVLTVAFPAKYTSTDPKHIERSNKIQGISVTPSAAATPAPETAEKMPDGIGGRAEADQPKSAPEPTSLVPTGNEIVDYLESKQIEPMDPIAVKKGERLARIFNLVFFAIAIILVPFTLFGTGYIYNRAFFTGWIVVSFIWVWTSMCICVIYPVVESTGALKDVSMGLLNDIRAVMGKRKPQSPVSADDA